MQHLCESRPPNASFRAPAYARREKRVRLFELCNATSTGLAPLFSDPEYTLLGDGLNCFRKTTAYEVDQTNKNLKLLTAPVRYEFRSGLSLIHI